MSYNSNSSNEISNQSTIILSGAISVKAAIEAGVRKTEKIWIDEKKHSKDFSYILKLTQTQQIPVQKTNRQTIDQLTQTSSHGGICAQVCPRVFLPAKQLLNHQNPFIVLLEGIEDPWLYHTQCLCCRGNRAIDSAAIVDERGRYCYPRFCRSIRTHSHCLCNRFYRSFAAGKTKRLFHLFGRPKRRCQLIRRRLYKSVNFSDRRTIARSFQTSVATNRPTRFYSVRKSFPKRALCRRGCFRVGL